MVVRALGHSQIALAQFDAPGRCGQLLNRPPVGEPRVPVGCAIATTAAAQGLWSRSPWLGAPPKGSPAAAPQSAAYTAAGANASATSNRAVRRAGTPLPAENAGNTGSLVLYAAVVSRFVRKIVHVLEDEQSATSRVVDDCCPGPTRQTENLVLQSRSPPKGWAVHAARQAAALMTVTRSVPSSPISKSS